MKLAIGEVILTSWGYTDELPVDNEKLTFIESVNKAHRYILNGLAKKLTFIKCSNNKAHTYQ